MLKIAPSSRISFYIEVVVLILMATGTAFVFSAGANLSSELDLSQFYKFTTLKQILFFPLAVAVMYTASYIDYRRFSFTRAGAWRSFTPYLLILAIALLTLVLIPGIGVERNYSRRWLELPLGPAAVSFQPSELAKWAVVFFFAAFLDRYRDSMSLYFKRFVPLCVVAGIVCALIVTQDFGTAALIALLAFLMLLAGRAKWWHFLTPLPVVVPMFTYAIMSSPTRINRITRFLDPDQMYHQARQSLIAISTGGIWGKGFGRGIFKYGHLPEDTTDFIFAVICEEMGFVGGVCIILLFALLLVLGIILVCRCKCLFGKLLATGIILSITIQAALNIGVVTVVLPTKGIPLPFISAGGTSMLLTAAMVGVLLNIARQTSAGERLTSDSALADRSWVTTQKSVGNAENGVLCDG
ncbi:Cell division protein FtsW [Anaerohalosphaera lusitana]|uniref:Probable peptidoglycan glycosyltransferase FtsW n=1 Tax=Anaerohalosphaera lusitana TaxID=1936003 RepID=A0A1U9NI98_9BACT|nr:putative peptidoglycan glycosyltransferase FtsW [Anaerohalosphaera lusitana]AQT67653.1 Cell division protein FtsW [Anaerohalosphaera lusitana]